jgi:hypothetical protein
MVIYIDSFDIIYFFIQGVHFFTPQKIISSFGPTAGRWNPITAHP